jgi:hypothetical protein
MKRITRLVRGEGPGPWWAAIAALVTLLPGAGQADVLWEAARGEPFGVGRITVPVAAGEGPSLEAGALAIAERGGRVYYPAFHATRDLPLVRQLLGRGSGGGPDRVAVYFLFSGTEPLELELHTPDRHRLTVAPATSSVLHQRLLRGWWLRYRQSPHSYRGYPPILQTYLATMLSERMGRSRLRVPACLEHSPPRESLDLLLQMEHLRLRIAQATVRGERDRTEACGEPVPDEIAWREPVITAPPDVDVEPIALRVPEECFYIRFARFSDYQWLRRLLEEYGGDLSRMVTQRATDAHLNERLEEQLGLRESVLAGILGNQVIGNVALIGRDAFLAEGAAIGILFEARSDILQQDLQSQRQTAVRRAARRGAVMQTVRIADRDVSLAATPDHRLRSFYVQHDNFHLVTNCRDIARRFLEAGDGKRALGQSDEFRRARQRMPLESGHAITVYLSRAFFRGLMSPRYQLELRRRLWSVSDGELLLMARLAAEREGYEDASVADLVAAGFLPRHAPSRPDGSRTDVTAAGQIVDSQRGARGTYLPIPDVGMQAVTRTEARWYAELADFHARNWPAMDPVLVGIQRAARQEPDVERVSIEACMRPFDSRKYGVLTSFVGPATNRRIQPLPDDIVSVQAVISRLAAPRSSQPCHLFLGLRDDMPRVPSATNELLRTVQIAREAPSYLGAWPHPGWLDLLGAGGPPDAAGFSRLPLLGLWRLQTPVGFSLLSPDRQILADVAPQLGVDEAEDEAQIRVRVGDLAESKFGQWLNVLDYDQARQASVGNARFLQSLSQQLGVPPDEAPDVARSLLGVDLTCTLGGQYELATHTSGLRHWVSTAWDSGNDTDRQDYRSPVMRWLRGISARITLHEDRLLAKAHVDMQRRKSEQGIELPGLNLFRSGRGQP